MSPVFFQAAGGLGLFLLGMIVMTDGLKRLTAKYLHKTLAQFTRSPLSGALTGAGTTAILQSSSATTVATVGFVSAGLLTFPQALGIIFGANLGTTITGWMVALLGIKLQLSTLLLPLILLGVLLHLFSHRRLASAGLAMAGFGLIFVGISMLQQGMTGLEGHISPASFPQDTFYGRIQLVLLGITITLITQSSSAGVATALTALHAGTISFPQAAALVIGMDVGTTVTAAIATLGGSVETRRTGYSHVIYNLLTAIVALLLLSPFVMAWQNLMPGGLHNNEIALVAFHSGFNLLGVALILPFAQSFARLMQYLVPAPQIAELDRLDSNLLKEPAIALTAVGTTLQEITLRLFQYHHQLVEQGKTDPRELSVIGLILDKTHNYVDQIHLYPNDKQSWPLITATVHTLDHLQRLHERCEEEADRAETLGQTQELSQIEQKSVAWINEIHRLIKTGQWQQALTIAAHNSEFLEIKTEDIRQALLADIAMGKTDVPEGTDRLEAIRWLRRSSYHIWRICHHMNNISSGSIHKT